jgi:hypothetical protein
MSRITSASGERWDFGLTMRGEDRNAIADFVSSEGFMIGKVQFLGHQTANGTFAVVAELVVE